MHFKKYLLAGLLVWLPLAVTVWVLIGLVGALDSVMSGVLTAIGIMVPTAQTGAVIEILRPLHGLGVVLVVVVLLLTGAMVSNVAGRWFVRQWDRLLSNIPIVKSIYTSIKKVSDTLFSSNGNAFRKAVLVQFPLPGSWTIAFQTGSPAGEVAEHLGSDYMSVYVPTTPNPTSGYFLVVRRSEVRELNMSVDQALTYVISMGAVAPDAVISQASASSSSTAPSSAPPSQH